MADDAIFDGFAPIDEQPVEEKTIEEKPKRGRKKGSTVTQSKATKKDVDLSIAVNTVGAMLAGLIGRPDLALSDDESKGLSTAANRVAAYYELPDMGVIGAWVNLGLTIGAIVYPRYAQVKAEKLEREYEKQVTEKMKEDVI